MNEDRLTLLRAELAAQALDAFIVPHADEFQNEYLPPHAERLAWVTGFTGSAGAAIVTADRAALFVDGRYTLQAGEQSPDFEPYHLIEHPPERWIEETLHAGARLGYDPWLHTQKQVEALEKAVAKSGAMLVAVARNPVDAAWTDRPPKPMAPILPHAVEYAGEPSPGKRIRIAETLRKGGIDAVVLTDPSAIAWLLNVRGGDVPCAPLPLSFAILHADTTVEWFVEREKLSPHPPVPDGTGPSLSHQGEGFILRDPSDFLPALASLSGKRVQADPAQCPAAVFEALVKANALIERGRDPCLLPRAAKNAAELSGSRAAHRRDGAALARFLAWFDSTKPRELTELDIVARLESFRAVSNLYRGPSFETIAGAGPNGAIVHYRATETSNRRLEADSFLLLDSGAQYLDGTTDITRTLPIGAPSAEMREMFTRVLKGHIAIATARFPTGTTGQQLDVLARQFLWQVHANYDHGTGHGVGSYLSVHEGPQRISPRAEAVELVEGMILSNEPGYYKTGAYGIRIENLIAVQGNGSGWLCFETLSLAPIDRACIDGSLLTQDEREWLNGYHARVRDALMPQLDGSDREWLEQATRAL